MRVRRNIRYNMQNTNTMKKNMTIDDLAVMTQKGFLGLDGKIMKLDEKVDRGFAEVNQRFFEVNQRLDKIEKDILQDYGNRIEVLEASVRNLQSEFRKSG